MEGHLPYQGRSHQPRVGYDEKSAEAIVVNSNELYRRIQMVSQVSEGLNVFSSLNSSRKQSLRAF